MEKYKNSVILAFMVWLQLCTITAIAQEVTSLHPLFTEKVALVDSSLFGMWGSEDLGDTLAFLKAGDNFYHLIYANSDTSLSFEAVLVKIDSLTILDIFPRLPAAMNDFYTDHLIPSHSFYRISIQSDTMRVVVLSYRWFYDAVANGKIPYGYEWAKNGILLTASYEELRNIFLKYHDEKDFYGDSFLFYRQIQKPPSISKKAAASQPASSRSGFEFASSSDLEVSYPGCQPNFPYVDGWLGGDGDLSTPLSKTQNLWI